MSPLSVFSTTALSLSVPGKLRALELTRFWTFPDRANCISSWLCTRSERSEAGAGGAVVRGAAPIARNTVEGSTLMDVLGSEEDEEDEVAGVTERCTLWTALAPAHCRGLALGVYTCPIVIRLRAV